MARAKTILRGLLLLMAVSTLNTDILSASLGKPVALAYGRHWVSGNVLFKDESDTARTIALLGLGEGEWDGVEQLIVHGVEIDLTRIGTDFHFHRGGNGELSSGSTLDPEGVGTPYPFDTQGDQRVDGFFPFALQGTTFSRTAYLALGIPYDIYAPSPELQVVGLYRCRRVRTFAENGVQTGYLFSDNPAWCIADLLTQVRGLLDSRIDWGSFYAASLYCDALIDPRGDGVQVKRFLCNVAFTEEVDFDTAVKALLATCRGHLQDTEGTIKLRIDQTRASAFDFQDHDTAGSLANIIEESFEAVYEDTRAVPNRLELIFRDPANGYQVMTKLWNHEPQQARTGRVIPAKIYLGNMLQDQAERIGNYLLTRKIDNNLHCRFTATASSLKVMPGDVVRVKHDSAPWSQLEAGATLYQSFEVLEVNENADETRSYLCRVYNAATYSDTAGPAQNLIGGSIRRRPLPPLAPDIWNLSGNFLGDMHLSFSIPVNTDYREGLLEVLVDEIANRSYSGGESTSGFTLLDGAIDAEQTEVNVNNVPGLIKVSEYATWGFELARVVGPGANGSDPGAAWEVERGVLGSIAAAKDDNSTVRRLAWKRYHFVMANGFSLAHPTIPLDNGEYYQLDFRPGSMLVLYAKLTMYDRLGQASPAVERVYSQYAQPIVAGALPGLKIYSGAPMPPIQIAGPLRVGEDLAAPFYLPKDQSIGLAYVAVDSAPVGASIIGRLRRNGDIVQDSLFGITEDVRFEIPAGEFGSGIFIRGDFIGNVGEQEFRIVIDQVGSEQPGSDLTLFIRP